MIDLRNVRSQDRIPTKFCLLFHDIVKAAKLSLAARHANDVLRCKNLEMAMLFYISM